MDTGFWLQIPTSDDGIVTVGAEVQFAINGPVLSKTNVQDLNHSLRMIAQTTLTNSLTTKTVASILSDRRFITLHIQVYVDCPFKAINPFSPSCNC